MNLNKLLEEVFDILDKVDENEDTPFKNNKDKQIYESNLMFIYRRGEAANYHLSNVRKIIANQSKTKLPDLKDKKEKYKNIQATAAITGVNNEISHEFIAFLSAIRSGLDFMSKFMIRHIKGVKGDSLKTLLKLNKNKDNQLLFLINQNEEWLVFLRNYRDSLIHNFNQVYHTKTVQSLECGQSKKTIYPIVVPKDIPNFELDTREHRYHFDVEEKYEVSEMRVEIITPTQKTVEVTKTINPGKGLVEITEFMENYYEKYCQLFCDFLKTLIEIDLKIIELKSL